MENRRSQFVSRSEKAPGRLWFQETACYPKIRAIQASASAKEEGMKETADQYRKRMFGHVEGRDPVKMLAAAPAKVAKLLEGLSPAKARKRPAPEKWSIAEIVAHIADTELVVGYRIRAIIGEPGTQIIGFDQDAWVTALHYEKRDLRKSFELYRGLREANVALLKTLTPEQWKHHGMHSERGEESIETIAVMFAGHDINHIGQIERILAAKRN
jgi:hypothetical protein